LYDVVLNNDVGLMVCLLDISLFYMVWLHLLYLQQYNIGYKYW